MCQCAVFANSLPFIRTSRLLPTARLGTGPLAAAMSGASPHVVMTDVQRPTGAIAAVEQTPSPRSRSPEVWPEGRPQALASRRGARRPRSRGSRTTTTGDHGPSLAAVTPEKLTRAHATARAAASAAMAVSPKTPLSAAGKEQAQPKGQQGARAALDASAEAFVPWGKPVPMASTPWPGVLPSMIQPPPGLVLDQVFWRGQEGDLLLPPLIPSVALPGPTIAVELKAAANCNIRNRNQRVLQLLAEVLAGAQLRESMDRDGYVAITRPVLGCLFGWDLMLTPAPTRATRVPTLVRPWVLTPITSTDAGTVPNHARG